MTFFDSDAPKLDGAVGLDAFVGRTITLIIQHKQLVVESKGSLAARVRTATEIAIRVVRDAEGVALAVDVAIPTGAGRAWMELDSGNGGSIVVSRAVAPLLNLDPSADKPQAATFNIAAGITVAGKVRTPQGMIMDGNIGSQFLENWCLTLDLANGRAWLAPVAN
jgi:hypothetical protein